MCARIAILAYVYGSYQFYKVRLIGFIMAGSVGAAHRAYDRSETPCPTPYPGTVTTVTRTGAPACDQVTGILRHVLKLARIIPDLAGAEAIATPHVAEALRLRPRIESAGQGQVERTADDRHVIEKAL